MLCEPENKLGFLKQSELHENYVDQEEKIHGLNDELTSCKDSFQNVKFLKVS